jgi:2'-5' RNA ligase
VKAAIVLLSDSSVQNYVRRIVFELNTFYGVEFYAATLPAHVSLKQPFTFEDMDVLEQYFDALAAKTAPFEIHLDRVYYEEWSGYAILGLNVVETARLRQLHDQINTDLSHLFLDTRAAHDGSGYRFHMTIELGKTTRGNGFREYFDHLAEKKVNLAFVTRELGMFYYTADTNSPGDFMTYRIQPLTGI